MVKVGYNNMGKLKEDWIEYSGNPSIRSYIVKKFIKIGSIFMRNKDLIQTRDLWESSAKKTMIPPEFEVKKVTIRGVDCEWILPKATEGKNTIIYLHGGGYVLGTLTTARSFASLLSKYSGEKVLSVDYRLAPEDPFPAGLEDSLAVYRKLLEEKTKPSSIIFIGDSAGGGLSLATVLALKEKEEPLPGGVVCLSPWTDLAATGDSIQSNMKIDPIFGGGSGVIKAEDYAGKENLFNPLISPLYGEYDGFPPLLIHVGTDEIILDDSIRVAEKARVAGAQVSLKIWRGMWHVFTASHSFLPEAKQSLKEIADFIKGLDIER